MQVQSHHGHTHCNGLLSGGEQGLVLWTRAVRLRERGREGDNGESDNIATTISHKAVIQLIYCICITCQVYNVTM